MNLKSIKHLDSVRVRFAGEVKSVWMTVVSIEPDLRAVLVMDSKDKSYVVTPNEVCEVADRVEIENQ